MRRAGGYAVLSDASGVREADTFTCAHCQHVVHVKPLADAADSGGLCKLCMGLICGACADNGSCTPWQRKFELMEAREHFLRSAGI